MKNLKKDLEDYDFIKFKNKIEKSKEKEIDVFYEYVIEKLKTKRLSNVVNLILYKDKSMEMYDIAIDIANKLRYIYYNKEHIPTLQYVYRILLDIAKNNKIVKNDIRQEIPDDLDELYVVDFNNNLENILFYEKLKLYFDEKEIKILKLYLNNYTFKEIGNIFGVSSQSIHKKNT